LAAILITGATGFVGGHAVEALHAAGLPVRALVRSPGRAARLQEQGVELVEGSLEDKAALRGAVQGVSTIVHLAAATRAASEAEFARANADGTRNLLDAAAAQDVVPRRFVYLSSLAAAGPATTARPLQPDDVPAPLTAYGRTKLEGEHLCRQHAAGMEVVILRAPAVYGPRDRDLFHFFRLAQLGWLPVPTGPVRSLQMIHVTDLARAIAAAVTAPTARGVYHVAEAQAYTWDEMGALVAAALGRPARKVALPAQLVRAAATGSEWFSRLTRQPGIFSRDKAAEMLAPGWCCETEGARRDLGFETRIPLADGFRETAQWYRSEGWLR
jgi:dihydroflavonol-4-reductase